ncbi:hypothetical protein D6745_04540 [Candidatus Woesearchaeota archaeon]|nr:MAG: hypothetical protein D6745_04540 [Candidatus Woesearchaeota archaeon]
MTFEKLKVSVGVSLVLFIFIVANVFAFGFAQKKYEDSLREQQKILDELNAAIIDTEKTGTPRNATENITKNITITPSNISHNTSEKDSSNTKKDNTTKSSVSKKNESSTNKTIIAKPVPKQKTRTIHITRRRRTHAS